jgi:hypothetical protein
MPNSVLFIGLEVFPIAHIDTPEVSKEDSLGPKPVPIDHYCFYNLSVFIIVHIELASQMKMSYCN